MGASSSKPLPDWSVDDVSEALASLGPKYVAYQAGVVENGVDGEIIDSLVDDAAVEETLDDLAIMNRLHRRVILKKLASLKEHTESSKGIANESEDKDSQQEFQVFDDIVLEALERTAPNTVYAGVHLVLEEGQVVLAGSFGGDEEEFQNPIPRFLLRPHEVSLCSKFVKEEDTDYFEATLPPEVTDGIVTNYSGYIISDENGARQGAVCVLDVAQDNDTTMESKQALLQELAAMAQEQIGQRKALVAREATLRVQIQQASPPNDPFANELKQVITDTKRHQSQLESTPQYEYDTAEALKSDSRVANAEEASHLPSNFFDVVDQVGAPHPPIAKDDMASIATVRELDLADITVDSTIGQTVKKLVSMACRMFDFAIGMVVFHDQISQFAIGAYARDEKAEGCLRHVYQVCECDSDGVPFSGQKDRATSMCNYALYLKKTFVVQDLSKDKTFAWYHKMYGVSTYVGQPLIDESGRVIGILVILDGNPRHDFDGKCEVQLEQIGHMILQEIQNWSMANKIEKLEEERVRLQQDSSSDRKSQPPNKEATIVLTDVEGSTSMWESDPHAMQEALEVHDCIMRECAMKFNGYEIDTEGDAFFLAFHDPADAIGFALLAQSSLYEAPDWSDNILALKEAAMEETGSLRGLRVRMGIHHGQVQCTKHEVSKRTEYSGSAWNVAKSVEGMSHGGQILTTLETWNLASSLGERLLGKFQVLDLGSHVLRTGTRWDEGVVTKSIVQLVPEALSFDYFRARRPSIALSDEMEGDSVPSVLKESTDATLSGRQFAPPITKRQIGPSFHDAPYENNCATVMFLYTDEIEKEVKDFSSIRVSLVRLLGELVVSFGKGYHCHSFMVVFDCELDALQFAFKYMEILKDRDIKQKTSVSLSRLVKFGCIHGQFLSMGPHKSSGRADYFGKVVNRAARVASAASPGAIYLGATGSSRAPMLEGVTTLHVGVKPLKGVKEEITLYECQVNG